MPLYFAYGSNMESRQMVSRCPSARFVGKATLEGYCVTFPRMSVRWQGGAASVGPDEDRRVEGVVYEMDEIDFEPLDRFEGVAKNRYYRCSLPVLLADGRTLEPEVYIANSEAGAPFPPDPGYLNQMIVGAQEHGLPEGYITMLKAIETTASIKSG